MLFKIVPEACKITKNDKGEDIAQTFDGYVVLDLPKFNKLLLIQKELSKLVLELKNKKTDEVSTVYDSLDAMSVCYEKLEPMISEVSLKHLESGFELKTVDDLSCYPYARPIVQELCLKLMYGFAEKN